MNRIPSLFLFSLFLFFPLSTGNSMAASVDPRVLLAVQQMEASFHSLEDYNCKVEQVFYQEGSEDQRSSFNFFFKKERKIRVDFTHPYSSLTLIYIEGDDKATVIPFRSMPHLKFRLSIHDSMLRTPAGQRIDQTVMSYFIQFVRKNLESSRQGDSEYRETDEEVVFSLFALDYIKGKTPEKYRIHLSKPVWLPTCIERYDGKRRLIETTIIRDYAINTRIDHRLFEP